MGRGDQLERSYSQLHRLHRLTTRLRRETYELSELDLRGNAPDSAGRDTPFWSFIAIPIVITMAGSVFAAFRRVPPTVQSGLQHFTAGVVFAALGGELLPEVLHRKAPLLTFAGFVVGVVVMFGLDRLTANVAEHEEEEPKQERETVRFRFSSVWAPGLDPLCGRDSPRAPWWAFSRSVTPRCCFS